MRFKIRIQGLQAFLWSGLIISISVFLRPFFVSVWESPGWTSGHSGSRPHPEDLDTRRLLDQPSTNPDSYGN